MFSKRKVKQTFFNSKKRINIRREFASQNRLRENFERKLRGQLKGYFTKVFNDFATEYENMGLIDTAFSRNQGMIFKIFDNHYRVVIEAFGLRMLNQLRKEESQFESIYKEYARENTGQNIVGINQTTRKHISKIVTVNLAENLGVAQIAKEIRKEGDSRFTRLRSATIARTETHNASSFANHRIAQSMNIPDQKKQWVATLDNRSRDTHLAMNGKTVPIDEDFIVGGRPMGYPSDPRGGASNVINCRCVVIYTSPEDVITDDTTITPKPRQARDIPKPIEFSITDVVLVTRGVKPEDYNEKLLSGTNDVQKKAMNNLPKPRKIVGSKKGFQQPYSHTISSNLDRSTLVHEYGHHIDQQIAYLEKLGKQDAIQLSKSSFNGEFIAFTDNNLELRQAFEKDKDKLKFGKLTTVPKKDREEYKRLRERNLQGFRDELFNIKKDTITEVTFASGLKLPIKNKGKKEFRYKNSDSLSDIVDSMVKGDFRSNYNMYGHSKNYWKRRDTDLSETFANFFASYSDESGRAFMQKYIPNTFKIMEKKLIEISNLPN